MVRFGLMLPVLFSLGPITVSSFGVFLALGFLFGVFLVWRLSRAWDLDEEQILDLTLLTFFGGVLGARLIFGLENLSSFAPNFLRLILVNKYPGFSFWGAFLGGTLSLFYFSKRFKLDFWHIADLVSVGFLGGLIFSDIGCLLGGCNVGIPSKLFFAAEQVGVIGKRFPVQGLEALLLTFVLINIWGMATHFHLRGKIASLSLIGIGIIRLITELLRQNVSIDYLFESIMVILGIIIFYKIHHGKRTPISDIKSFFNFFVLIFSDRNFRKFALDRLLKNWYNRKAAFGWKIKGFSKFLRRIRVRSTPKNS